MSTKYKLNLPMYHPAISYETSFVDGDFGEESNTDMHKSQLQFNQNKATRHATITAFSNYPIFSLHTNPPHSLPPSDTESRVASISYKYVNETKAAVLKNETSPLINDQHNFSSIADDKALNLDAVPDKHALKSKEEADVAEPAKSCGCDGAEQGSTRIAAASGRSRTFTCLEVDVVTTESSNSYVNKGSKRSKYIGYLLH